MSAGTERDLLFGLFALQNGLIEQGALVAAFQAWTRDKAKPLARHLVERGDLDQDDAAAIAAMVARHIRKHDGDPEKSLAAVSAGRSTRDKLAALADPDLNASLPRVRSRNQDEEDSLRTTSVGESTSDGQRFRVLRPHARGGLGAVFVALDGELKREVALKEILNKYADDSVSRQRFLVEAEITGGLEHPGIVPVYGLGSYGDGRPFYAMRFIKGDSLRDAIKKYHADERLKKHDGERSLELRKLLRRFLDVCNAIDYAHSRGVLHRDIKPGNIIVGKHGETLVVDWGLARAKGASESTEPSDERPLIPSSASGSAETHPGRALGTPEYMSPEQARGDLEALGPATDVYALGATLYSLLTNKPRIAGADAGEKLRAVQAGAFARPRALDSSIDKALEAVCLKAMSLRPGDRYVSSKALADDVERWLADEPVTAISEPLSERVRRWVKKNRTLVTGTAAALVVGLIGLGGIATVQTRARNDLANKNNELVAEKAKVIQANADLTSANTALDEQRKRAEDREQLAIDAVKKFRDTVANEPMLKNTPALEELRKKLLREPLSFFRDLRDRLQADADTQPESLTKLASAAYELGQLTSAIGNKEDALKAYQESLEIMQKLVAQNPTATEYQNGLAGSHNNIGVLLSETGKPDDAFKAYEAALEIKQKLVAHNPTVTEFQSNLAMSHNNIGNLLRATGKPDEALKAHEAALEIRRKLVAQNPTVTEFQSNLAMSHNNIGNLLRATGKPDEALKAHEAALEIRRKLAAENPTVTGYQTNLAMSHNSIGVLLSETGKPDDAFKAYEAAREIRQKLVADNPTVTEYQNDLAASHNNIGNLLSDTGKPADAFKAHEAAREIQQKLVAQNPTATEYQNDLAGSHYDIGILLSDTGKPDEALKSYEAALEIWRKLAAENPTVTGYQNNLAISHNSIGILLRHTGKPDDALKSYEAALEIQQKLAAQNPTVTDFQRYLAYSHNSIGVLLRETGKPDEALKAYEAALKLRRKLVHDHPDVPDYIHGLGTALNESALVELYNGRFKEGQKLLKEAIECHNRALAVNPGNTEYKKGLLYSRTNMMWAISGIRHDGSMASTLALTPKAFSRRGEGGIPGITPPEPSPEEPSLAPEAEK